MSECPNINPTAVTSLFHWNNPPEDKTTPCLCKDRIDNLDPVSITGYFIKILKSQLTADNVDSPKVAQMLRDSGVYITALSQYNSKQTGKKPRVIIEFSGKKSQQDFAFFNKQSYNMSNGSQDYSDVWHMAFTVYVIANSLNETLYLAQEVCNFFHRYQWIIQKHLCWLKFQVIEMQKAQCLSDDSGSQSGYIVPISMTAIAEDHWVVTEISPVLKRVDTAIEDGAY